MTIGHIRGHGCQDLLGRCHYSATVSGDAPEQLAGSWCSRRRNITNELRKPGVTGKRHESEMPQMPR